MNPEGVRWLNQFAGQPLNDRQRVTLLYLRQHERINNPDYRRLNRVDPLIAGQELRGLVEAGLAESNGVGRGTTYRLAVPRETSSDVPVAGNEEDRIVGYIRQHGSITSSDCQQILGVGADRAYYLLKKLADDGRVRPEGTTKGTQVLPEVAFAVSPESFPEKCGFDSG